MKLHDLTVAMVEPKRGLNVGYVARTMKNFGLFKMLIVGLNEVPSSAFRFASHGSDIVRNVRLVDFDFIKRNYDLVIGTTAIASKRGRNPTRKAITIEQLASLGLDPAKSIIVLGRDTTGLNNEELLSCDVVVHIPTGTTYETLNISHALSIMLYVMSSMNKRPAPPLNRKYVELAESYFVEMLALGDYPYHKRLRAVKLIKKVLIKSGLDDDEATTIIGVFRKMALALKKDFE